MFIAKLLTAVIAGRTIAANLRGEKMAPPSGETRAATSSSRTSPPAGGKRAAGAEKDSSSSQEDAIPAQQAGEAGPDSPLELQSDDWRATLKRTLAEIKADRVTLVAAGMGVAEAEVARLLEVSAVGTGQVGEASPASHVLDLQATGVVQDVHR